MIFLITNKNLVTHNVLLMKIRAAALAGVDYILLRENQLNDQAYFDLALSVMQMLTGTRTELVICHRPRIAEELGLKQHARYQERTAQSFSVSTHSKEELVALDPNQYAFYGNVFETTCKPSLGARGLDALNCHPNAIALGGINLTTLHMLDDRVKHIGIMSEWLAVEDLRTYIGRLREKGY